MRGCRRRDALSNKRMKLAVALAPAPRVNAVEGHSACPLFSGHRAPAAYAWCSTDADGKG
jgi:hypothetical protein